MMKMEKYCQRDKPIQNGWQRDIGNYDNQSSSFDYLNGFNQQEKAKIFNDVYSCIDMFYQLVND